MNLINYITHLPIEDRLYTFFLSYVKREGTDLVCDYDIDNISDDFGDDAEEGLSKLIDSGVIILRKGVIHVGNRIGNTYKLFERNESSPDAEYKMILQYAEEFCDISSLGKVVANELKELIEKPILNVPESLKFFRGCYEVVYQEQLREFYAKEVGQMKNLLRVYSVTMLKRIIIKYCIDCEKYKTTNIGGLCFYADAVSKELSEKTKKKKRRTHTDNDTF